MQKLFQSRDPSSGSIWQPSSLNGSNYANANPVNLVDLSGRSASAINVDCNGWPFYLKDDCELANQGDRDAIKRILQTTVDFALAGAIVDDDYLWHAIMMGHYLSAKGTDLSITFDEDDDFPNDPGIRRATREFREPEIPTDEPGLVIPLLHDFLENHLKPLANCGAFGHTGVNLFGRGHYFFSPTGRLSSPRAYSSGYWAAFGHVEIDGFFSAIAQVGNVGIDGPGYLVEYDAQYQIDDSYEWFPERNLATPVPFPGGRVSIPHEWTASLQTDLAREFDFVIRWTESDVLWVSFSFEEFRSLRRGGYRQRIRGNYVGAY